MGFLKLFSQVIKKYYENWKDTFTSHTDYLSDIDTLRTDWQMDWKREKYENWSLITSWGWAGPSSALARTGAWR